MSDFEIKLVKYNGNEKNVVIPHGVTVIGKKAFDECRSVESVVIPEGVVVIEESAFEDCENLRFVKLPGSLREIGVKAFEDCKSLERVELPASIRCLCEEVFGDCDNLQGISLPYRSVKLPVEMLEQVEINAHNLAAVYLFQRTKTAERMFFAHADEICACELAEELLNALEGHETPGRCEKCARYLVEHKDSLPADLSERANALFAKVGAAHLLG